MDSERPKKDYRNSVPLILKFIGDSHPGATKKQLMKIIGLDSENPSDERQLRRLIERLQALGYPVVHDIDSDLYFLDSKRMFKFEATSADLTLLKTAIREAPTRSTQTALVLENALGKLHATGSSYSHSPSLSADIPSEDLLLQIVSSIERKKRARFAYSGAKSGARRWRIFDPYLVFSRSRVFYVCGRARPDAEESVENTFDALDSSTEEWEWRTYRISRIEAKTYDEVGERDESYSVRDAYTKVSSFFEVSDVLLGVRPGKAQGLRALTKKIDELHPALPTGWDCYHIDRIDKRFLFERLMTYGNDVRLLAPENLRTEWGNTLRHLATLGVER